LLAGFVGGLPIGFSGIPALTDHDAVFVLSTGAGFGIVGGAVLSGSVDPPPALADSAAARGAAYEQAFRKEYVAQLHRRRARAALGGGVAGVVSGFALLFWALSQIST
jgi:hypothetical protein